MEIPNLPTDNLYKFAALSGLVLLLAPQFLFSQMATRLEGQADETGMQIAVLDVDVWEAQTRLENETGELEFQTERLNQRVKSFESAAKETTNKAAKLKQQETLAKELDALHSRLIQLKDAKLRADADLKRHRATLRMGIDRERHLLRYLKLVGIAAIFAGAIAVVVTLWGFRRWMELQRVQDALMRAQVRPLSLPDTSGTE